MKLIVGLGNPGQKYFGTRHNIGRAMVELIAAEASLKFSEKRPLKSCIASMPVEDKEILLSFPTTFMNLSGQSVQALIRSKGIDFARDLLVIVDDLDLPVGHLRLRVKGSCGGHNGLRSIEQSIGSNEFARLRIGVGHPGPGGDVSHYVLSKFRSEEREALLGAKDRVREACSLWAFDTVESAMSVVNSSN